MGRPVSYIASIAFVLLNSNTHQISIEKLPLYPQHRRLHFCVAVTLLHPYYSIIRGVGGRKGFGPRGWQ